MFSLIFLMGDKTLCYCLVVETLRYLSFLTQALILVGLFKKCKWHSMELDRINITSEFKISHTTKIIDISSVHAHVL